MSHIVNFNTALIISDHYDINKIAKQLFNDDYIVIDNYSNINNSISHVIANQKNKIFNKYHIMKNPTNNIDINVLLAAMENVFLSRFFIA